MKNLSIVFLSILFESLPFLLLGAFISAIIEHYVSEEKMAKMFPKNIFLGSIVGIFLGFFLPACDCAVIPISKRLIQKRVPISVAVSFMLASPIINPVVLLSTYTAFSKVDMSIFYYRLILGIIVSLIIGIIMGIIFKDKEILKDSVEELKEDTLEDDFKELEKYTKNNHYFFNNVKSILEDTSKDFYDVLKYLMVGAIIASSIQVFMPRSILTFFNANPICSIIVLMIFAYLISLCSNSDSFIGRSLLNTFGSTGVLAYLILGPMIDIKNTIVLMGNFKSKFVWSFIGLIFLFVFLFSLVVGVL